MSAKTVLTDDMNFHERLDYDRLMQEMEDYPIDEDDVFEDED